MEHLAVEARPLSAVPDQPEAMTSPYSARTSDLQIPERGEPGATIPCNVVLRYEGSRPCLDPRLTLVSAETFLDGEARVDGTPIASERIHDGIQLRLPPLAPGQTLTVNAAARIPLGLPNGTVTTVHATLSAHGGSISLTRQIVVASSPTVDPDYCVLDLEGPDYLILHQTRSLQVAVHNSGTADATDVRLIVADLRDLDVEATTIVGSIPAGQTRIVTLAICAHGLRPQLTLDVAHSGGTCRLPQRDFIARRGAQPRAALRVDGALPLPDAPKRLALRVAVHNDGDAPATGLAVHLDLPTGIVCADRAEPLVRFPALPPGGDVERTVLLDCEGHGLTTTVLIDAIGDADGTPFAIEPLRLAIARVQSLVLHRFALPAMTAGVRATTHLDILADGNAPVEAAAIRLSFGDGLAYDGDLTINGVPIADDTFAATGELTLEAVPPGQLIALRWTTRALHASVRGTSTTISASLNWPGAHVSGSAPPIRITPGVTAATALEQLPFRVAGAVAKILDATPAAPPMTPTSPSTDATPPISLSTEPAVSSVQDTNAPEHPRPAVADSGTPAESTAEAEEDTTPTTAAVAAPTPSPAVTIDGDRIATTRRRLVLAAQTGDPLSAVIIALGALGDLGTHPATDDYRAAVAGLRAVTGALLSGRGVPPTTRNALRSALTPFASVDGSTIGLLEGLGAIAREIADSDAAPAWWPHVRAFGQTAFDALRVASEHLLDFDQSDITVPELATAIDWITALTNQLPVAA